MELDDWLASSPKLLTRIKHQQFSHSLTDSPDRSQSHLNAASDQIVSCQLWKCYMRLYPKVSGLAAWSENCKCYRSLPQGAVMSQFYESF